MAYVSYVHMIMFAVFFCLTRTRIFYGIGLPELRKAVSVFHAIEDEIESTEDQVVIGPGSKELIFLTMKVYNGGN